ncbi:MAG: NADH-quinone oxidoreductase subunit M [Magnetococcales bacterium]|nr:NADH-quinone oxidoreductase subunit M [Magnetococcales bacterium]
MPPLLLLLLLPTTGALLVALLPSRLAHRVATGAALATMLWSGWVASLFSDRIAHLQLLEKIVWRPRLGSHFALGVDGLSLPMLLLATLLTLVAVLASGHVRTRVKGYFIPLLLLEAAMLGVFAAQDWSLFYIFWELTLLPLFFLINNYGGAQRNRAALNFLLYTMGGSVFLLLALLLAYDALPEHTFLMTAMAEGLRDLPREKQILIFLGFFIGFGVKMPVFPLHGWLPLAHVEAPAPVSILLSGVLLKMGSYGLLRTAILLPDAVSALQGGLAALAMINLLHGGVLAWRQIDLKGMIAYSSVSHMGVVLLGIATLESTGLTGAVLQMVSHGLTAGALFLVIGLLYERTHTRDIREYGSLTVPAPQFAFFTVVAFVASVGVPGTSGFIAELHVLIGSLQRWGAWSALLSVGMLVSAAYAVRTIGVLCTGPACQLRIDPPRRPEWIAAAMLTLTILLVGVVPAPLIGKISATIDQVSDLFAHRL